MNTFELPDAQLWLLVGVLCVWVVVVVDILRQGHLRPWAKLAWIAGCTLVWPLQMVYLLVRPQRSRLDEPEDRSDGHARMVQAILDREAGRIDDHEWAERLRTLRQPGP